jgi:glycosyltransferase involved in cell wall biosynthesis
MKVVHIMNELRPSGAEVMLRLAAPVWIDRGVDLFIISCGSTTGVYAEILSSAGYRIYSCPRQRSWKAIAWFYRLIRVFKEVQPEVVHVHCEAQAPLIVLAARFAGVRTMIRTVHSVFQYTGLLRARKTFERGLMRTCRTRNIAISESVRLNEMERFRNRTRLINNWIDVSHFRPPTTAERRSARQELGVDRAQKLIVSVGNGCDIKNYQSVVRAINSLSSSNDLIYFQVGNEHCDGADRRLVEELNLGERVKFIGPVANVRTYLWASDVYIMPSLFEGFGLAAAEALACGVPCIFSDVPGLKDWKQKGLQIIWAKTPAAVYVEQALLHFLRIHGSTQRSLCAKNVEIIHQDISAQKGAIAYLDSYR